MRYFRLSIVAIIGAVVVLSSVADVPGNPTYYKHIMPIIQENCQVCHRSGGRNMGGMLAPMALTSYEDTRPWAKSIAKQVANRVMPPWHASPQHRGVFENELVVTDAQIQTISRWVDQGVRRGNPNDAPPPKHWPEGKSWAIGKPDLILSIPKRFFVEDDVTDLQQPFTSMITESMLPEERVIKAIEFRPGSTAVHHMLAVPLGGGSPGRGPQVFPKGIGQVLKPKTKIKWEIHYHKEAGPGTGVYDRSKIGIQFYPLGEKVDWTLKGSFLRNNEFLIPPGDPNYSVQQDFTFGADARIVSFSPHMHLRGKSARYEAFYPNGTSELLLLIPRYDFNWQTSYRYKELKKVPAGTRLVFTSTFDNSAENPHNPDPTKAVGWGAATSDEMMVGGLAFVNDLPE